MIRNRYAIHYPHVLQMQKSWQPPFIVAPKFVYWLAPGWITRSDPLQSKLLFLAEPRAEDNQAE
jgi:hypothetical protein